MSVTLVHHWIEYFRGGEAVLEQFALLFPEAPIYALVHDREHMPKTITSHAMHGSWFQKSSFTRRRFRIFLPFFPAAIDTLRLPKNTTIVLTSDASIIKGVPLPKGARQVCYCHSPPRYLWGQQETYLKSSSHNKGLGKWIFKATIPLLRGYDARSARRVHRFIANSKCVQDRIKKYYGRESEVIYPPVSIGKFNHTRPREDFYLVVSALVPYKRVDMAVDAANRLGRKLVVIGTGSEDNELKRRAGPTVTLLGWQPSSVVRDHLERCKAFLFPGIEDFGITPCEAQAAGAPVIAYGEGGALETVRPGYSGEFFTSQTVDSLVEVLERFEQGPGYPAHQCRANVSHLGPDRFRQEIHDYLVREYPECFKAPEQSRSELLGTTPIIFPNLGTGAGVAEMD